MCLGERQGWDELVGADLTAGQLGSQDQVLMRGQVS